MYRGGRPGERGIEAQKAPYTILTASDLDLSHLSGVCPGLDSRLGGYAVRAVRPLYARARVLGFGRVRTKPPGSGILLGFLVRAASYRLLARYRIRYGVRMGTAHQGGSEPRLEAAFYLA